MKVEEEIRNNALTDLAHAINAFQNMLGSRRVGAGAVENFANNVSDKAKALVKAITELEEKEAEEAAEKARKLNEGKK